jgi:aminopeptidase N
VQALADTPTVIEDVKALMGHEAFDANNPNVMRALVNTFAGANPGAFHKKDGAGYEFIADQVIDIDKRNPQVAARLASSFSNWKRHDEARQKLMQAQLERIQQEASSEDTKEIVSKTLALA